MKTILTIALFLLVGNVAMAQCGQTRSFVTNVGFESVKITNQVNLGYSDVQCANGVCVAPLVNHHGYYNQAQTLVLPQSTLFFAASNPNVLEFRTREYLQVPGTSQVIVQDSFGNPTVLNAGIRSGFQVQSRGALLFSR